VEETTNGDWEVSWKLWEQDGTYTEGKENWDAVVIATAWYDHAKWPDIQGLESARAAGLAVHAVQWKGPDAYAGKVSYQPRCLHAHYFVVSN
jgi:cation diffusion facilitator CzcD-associated flavoprotein CzcO